MKRYPCAVHKRKRVLLKVPSKVARSAQPKRTPLLLKFVMACCHKVCPHLVLTRWRAWRWRIVVSSTVRGLRLLKFDAVLLPVVVRVCAAVVVAVVALVASGILGCRVRRSGLRTLLVGVVWLCVAGPSSPASAVERLATGLATTTCGNAAALVNKWFHDRNRVLLTCRRRTEREQRVL
jgi:hypothetical protein